MKVFLGSDYSRWWEWASSNQMKAWIEWKGTLFRARRTSADTQPWAPNCNFSYFFNNKLFLLTRYPNFRRTLFFTPHTFTMLLVSFYLSVPMRVIWSSVLVRFISLASYRNSILSSLKAKTRNILDHVSGKLMGTIGFAHIQTQESDEWSGLHLSCHLPA